MGDETPLTIFTEMGETAEASAPVVRKMFELQRDREEALNTLQQILELGSKASPGTCDSWTLCQILDVAAKTYHKHRKPVP